MLNLKLKKKAASAAKKGIAMVDDMVALLAKEQMDDNDRRKYARCSWTRLRRT